ncbi:MAG: hypothetical protein AVDCRST_MAG64-4215, partial [uncultured Phycisphaerae bacterium]
MSACNTIGRGLTLLCALCVAMVTPVEARAAQSITALELQDAIEATAAQFPVGDLSFYNSNLLDKTGFRYDQHVYKVVKDGDRFFANSPAGSSPL